jgi:hypothetical protein
MRGFSIASLERAAITRSTHSSQMERPSARTERTRGAFPKLNVTVDGWRTDALYR